MISSRYIIVTIFFSHLESFIIDILVHLSFQPILFIQAMFKSMPASKQATEMDHERVRLEARVREV